MTATNGTNMETFEVEKTTKTTFGKKRSFFSKNKKGLAIGTGILLVILFVVFLTLGLTIWSGDSDSARSGTTPRPPLPGDSTPSSAPTPEPTRTTIPVVVPDTSSTAPTSAPVDSTSSTTLQTTTMTSTPSLPTPSVTTSVATDTSTAPTTSASTTTGIPEATSSVVTETTAIVPQTSSEGSTSTEGPVVVPVELRVACPSDMKAEEIDQAKCEAFAGCRFDSISTDNNTKCYLDPTETNFAVTALDASEYSETFLLNLNSKASVRLYDRQFVRPRLGISKVSNNIVRFKFDDDENERYEVPLQMERLNIKDIDLPQYEYTVGSRIQDFRIRRKSTQTPVWSMELGGLVLENQFLQIVNKLPSSNIFGLGDNRHPTLKRQMDRRTYPMFSRDEPITQPDGTYNLYGVHPFYMCVEEDGNAHGVLLWNSNAMEYMLQPTPAITLRSIGGVLDFIIFMGPTPENVVQQYTEFTGRSFLPPYWALGFQISRWGFKDLAHVKRVVDRNIAAGIPLDAVYGDIDYMRHRQDFTYDNESYNGLPEYIDEIHKKGMRYVIILDPAIHADAALKYPTEPTYLAYESGVEQDVFVKWPQNFLNNASFVAENSDPEKGLIGPKGIMLGKVWPDGRSAFPDYMNRNTWDWWDKMMKYLYDDLKIKFDAIWIDMNEVSSFDTNYYDPNVSWYCNKPDQLPGNHTCFSLQCPADSVLENPPYKTMAMRNFANPSVKRLQLSDKTICMDAEFTLTDTFQTRTFKHYDVHSLYGHYQSMATSRAAEYVLPNQRPFVFSRSTYTGSQKYAGHWLGDNASQWADLRHSLVGLMEYTIFGFSYIGSDICGFFDPATVEMCAKWHVAGAFYPFARNHNSNTQPDQDPAYNATVAEPARKALMIRYTLLPYLYTLFYRAHIYGDTVNRPLHHIFPRNQRCLSTDDQFFWGPALMISPILDDKSERAVFIPPGDRQDGQEFFYNYHTGAAAFDEVRVNWNVDLVGLHIRSGFVIPTQDPAVTTVLTRENPFRFLIAADRVHPEAKGELFWDDGISRTNKNCEEKVIGLPRIPNIYALCWSPTDLGKIFVRQVTRENLEFNSSWNEENSAKRLCCRLQASPFSDTYENGQFFLADLEFSLSKFHFLYTIRHEGWNGNNKSPDMSGHSAAELRLYTSYNPATPDFWTNLTFFLDGEEQPEGWFNVTRDQQIVSIQGGLPMDRSFALTFLPKGAGSRLNCAPEGTITKADCEAKGCVFDSNAYPGWILPQCYFNSATQGYQRESSSSAKAEADIVLTAVNPSQSISGSPPIPKVRIAFSSYSAAGLRFRITDAEKGRYEVPQSLMEFPFIPSSNALNSDQYLYEIQQEEDTSRPFSFRITRRSSGSTIFDTSLGGMVFEDQFLQIVTKLDSTYVYGFGENRHPKFRHAFDWRVWPMFARDEGPIDPTRPTNHYGVHPFYIVVEKSGDVHGVFLLNSNAMEYQFQPAPALTLRALGGVFDFFVFMGPTVDDVLDQYTRLIGRPSIPPYWAFGFQICRWGYNNLSYVETVINRTREARIPHDVQYIELDYMDKRQMFTIDQENFAGVHEFIQNYRDEGYKFFFLLDPFIHAESELLYPNETGSNPSYRDGLANDVFIKWPVEFLNDPDVKDYTIGPDNIMLGKAWPDGFAAYPDFFKKSTYDWWKKWIADNSSFFEFDGLWIDMNEPVAFETNMIDTSQAWYCASDPTVNNLNGNHTCLALQCPRGANNPWDKPPYMPVAATAWAKPNWVNLLSDKTLCMVGLQTIETETSNQSVRHYDVHNLYGIQQTKLTQRIAQELTGKRSWVISRSTYPGSGRYAGHWLGDNKSQWSDMAYSIIGMFEFNLFGIPYVGADICGFFDNTTEELCRRWQVLGAFYPMSRNHNTRGPRDQDPAVWPSVAEVTRDAMNIRYSFLPYLYTLFYEAHQTGAPVVRPLFYDYNTALHDKRILDIDRQFMWGHALMFAPFIDPAPAHGGEETLQVYFPSDTYYQYPSGQKISGDAHTRSFRERDLPEKIGIFLRAGHIVPTQAVNGALKTSEMRSNPFELLIASHSSNGHEIADGVLFWDDWESQDTVNSGDYYATFHYDRHYDGQGDQAYEATLSVLVERSSPEISRDLRLHSISVFGYEFDADLAASTDVVFTVVVGNDFTEENFAVQHEYSTEHQKLTISGFNFSLAQSGSLTILETRRISIDCSPFDPDRDMCLFHGCIWNEGPLAPNQPACIYPTVIHRGYTAVDNDSSSETGVISVGAVATTSLTSGTNLPNIFSGVQLTISPVTDNILRIKITDRNNPTGRYEVPCLLAPFGCAPAPAARPANPVYDIEITPNGDNQMDPLWIRVTRKSTGKVLWDTSIGALIMSDQYLEISTKLPSRDVYGLGEHSRNTFHHDLNYKTWGMWSMDQPPGGPQNLYGVHPYVMVVEDEEGHAFGSLLLNSNAMEVAFNPYPAMTYRTVGGIFDFFLFIGDSPADVTRHYLETIGKPFVPPYWAFGFQISRYGYNNLDNMRNAVERTRAAEIPLDVFYGDIDYFRGERNFMIGDAFQQLPQYVQNKSDQGMHFVTILDPCIAADPADAPFVRGLTRNNTFVRWPAPYTDTNNQSYQSFDPSQPPYLLGHVWPTTRTVFIDFMHQSGRNYWDEEVRLFHDAIDFSALWIDMNEPAAFGTNGDDTWYQSYSEHGNWSLKCTEGDDNKWENPPYRPRSLNGGQYGKLSFKSICMNAVQGDRDYRQYDVHSLYGHSQIEPSLRTMQGITNKRSFVFSRSTFVGSGAHSGHWLGDNNADWNQLRQSVIGMMEFNLFGIPYVGADICGYFSDTTPELCTRWMQLGAFYPFSRNHNGKGCRDQDPLALGPMVAQASKIAMEHRYRLLPFLYSTFWTAHTNGETVVKSLMEVFPTDMTARSIQEQFMWSDCLLISPVLHERARSVNAYFPEGSWYDFVTGAAVRGSRQYHTLPADLMTIPLHVRGGCILPMQNPRTTTRDSLREPRSLWIAPDSTGAADGRQIWDQGEDILDDSSTALMIQYKYSTNFVDGNQVITISGQSLTYPTLVAEVPPYATQMPLLDTIMIAGSNTTARTAQLEIDGAALNAAIDVQFVAENQVLHIRRLPIPAGKRWTLTIRETFD